MIAEERMKIIITEIEDEGLEIEFSEPLEGNNLLRPVGDVRASLVLNRIAEELSIKGNITGRVTLQCSRCLIEFEKDLSVDVDLTYLPIEEMGDEEAHELSPDESDIAFYRNDEIDIEDVIREQLILNLPMKPLCSDDCKGLCPVCGEDLNLQNCSCNKTSIDPRFEILKKLLSDRKEN